MAHPWSRCGGCTRAPWAKRLGELQGLLLPAQRSDPGSSSRGVACHRGAVTPWSGQKQLPSQDRPSGGPCAPQLHSKPLRTPPAGAQDSPLSTRERLVLGKQQHCCRVPKCRPPPRKQCGPRRGCCFVGFFQKLDFFHLKGRVAGTDRHQSSSTCWFAPQMVARARNGPG